MTPEEAYEAITQVERMRFLDFQEQEYHARLRSELIRVSEASRTIFAQSILAVADRVGFRGRICGKNYIGCHFGRNYADWKVVGWIEMQKRKVNLWLRPPTRYTEFDIPVVALNRRGTPHGLVLGLTRVEHSQHVRELLQRSEVHVTW